MNFFVMRGKANNSPDLISTLADRSSCSLKHPAPLCSAWLRFALHPIAPLGGRFNIRGGQAVISSSPSDEPPEIHRNNERFSHCTSTVFVGLKGNFLSKHDVARNQMADW